MEQSTQLEEVFGYSIADNTVEAQNARSSRLCPFNNVGAFCTKDKKEAPLGVCTLRHLNQISAICPVRFRENWRILNDAAKFFFPEEAKWTCLPEVRLPNESGKGVGKIDFVLVAYDEDGLVTNYGGLEVQSVYISGNIRVPFEAFMESPDEYGRLDWAELKNSPHPDFLSSLKRVIPQLYTKSRVLRKWGRKMAIAVDEPFFNSLPPIEAVGQASADLLWLVYGFENAEQRSKMVLRKRVHCDLRDALSSMMDPSVGEESQFITQLQAKMRGVL